jgi:hypothetical protein
MSNSNNSVAMKPISDTYELVIRDSKAANLAASLQSSLFKLTSFMFVSSVAESHTKKKLAIGLGEIPLQSNFLLKIVIHL